MRQKQHRGVFGEGAYRLSRSRYPVRIFPLVLFVIFAILYYLS